jgi:hypothetical protein
MTGMTITRQRLWKMGPVKPRNCSHQALPFVEATTKAKLAGSRRLLSYEHMCCLSGDESISRDQLHSWRSSGNFRRHSHQGYAPIGPRRGEAVGLSRLYLKALCRSPATSTARSDIHGYNMLSCRQCAVVGLTLSKQSYVRPIYGNIKRHTAPKLRGSPNG